MSNFLVQIYLKSLRKKLIGLIEKREACAKKVIVNDDVFDNIQHYNIDSLEELIDANDSLRKKYNNQILFLLRKMEQQGYNIDEFSSRYDFIRMLLSDEDSLKLNRENNHSY